MTGHACAVPVRLTIKRRRKLEQIVRTWRGRFAVRGIPGLFDKPRSGRPETHGPSARLAVLAVATSVPPEGESQWSRALIAGHLGKRGLAISAATVGRVLAEARVRPHRVRGWLNRVGDPSFWARAGQVCRLYLNPGPRVKPGSGMAGATAREGPGTPRSGGPAFLLAGDLGERREGLGIGVVAEHVLAGPLPAMGVTAGRDHLGGCHGVVSGAAQHDI